MASEFLYPTELQVQTWREEAKRRYPGFDLCLQFRRTNSRLEYSLHFDPLPGAPSIKPGVFFPLRPVWQPLQIFWGSRGDKTEIEMIFGLYPTQEALRIPDGPRNGLVFVDYLQGHPWWAAPIAAVCAAPLFLVMARSGWLFPLSFCPFGLLMGPLTLLMPSLHFASRIELVSFVMAAPFLLYLAYGLFIELAFKAKGKPILPIVLALAASHFVLGLVAPVLVRALDLG